MRMRSGVWRLSAVDGVLVVILGAPGMSISSKPVRPVSIDAQRLLQDSWKVRPMAMTSPTDFIAVVSVGSEPGNFSKAKRGILVTT
jgi:hypothetical protein